MSSATHGTTPYYFVPGPSRHPVMASIGLFFVILGAGQWINGVAWGKYSLLLGMLIWLSTLVWCSVLCLTSSVTQPSMRGGGPKLS